MEGCCINELPILWKEKDGEKKDVQKEKKKNTLNHEKVYHKMIYCPLLVTESPCLVFRAISLHSHQIVWKLYWKQEIQKLWYFHRDDIYSGDPCQGLNAEKEVLCKSERICSIYWFEISLARLSQKTAYNALTTFWKSNTPLIVQRWTWFWCLCYYRSRW